MSTNAFASPSAAQSTHDSAQKNTSENTVENSYAAEHIGLLSQFSSEHKLMIGGSILLGVGLLFVIVSNFGGGNLKASLANQAPSSTENTQVLNTQNAVQKTEIVYKDQYGNILTDDQVQNILNPVKTETVTLTQPLPEGEEQSNNSGENVVTYPEISGEAVQIDDTKSTLYVKEDDAAKLLAENRLVKKIVDNRPVYVEPISGAIVELIQPIERPLVGRISFIPPAPSVVAVPDYLRGNSSGEVSRVAVSSGEVTRNSSSSEVGR